MRHHARFGTWITLGVFVLWSLVPIYWLINMSLQSPTETTSLPPTFIPTFDISAYHRSGQTRRCASA